MTFQKGEGGRAAGVKNKLTDIKEQFGDSFELTGGLKAFVEWGKEHRATYYKIMASIFPKEAQVNVEHKHEDFINRLEERERKKQLEAGKPFKMIETGGVETGIEQPNKGNNGEDTPQKDVITPQNYPKIDESP